MYDVNTKILNTYEELVEYAKENRPLTCKKWDKYAGENGLHSSTSLVRIYGNWLELQKQVRKEIKRRKKIL